jgi:L-amino acid N-acyltransferase YncA
MITELNSTYAVHTCVAVLKAANFRSMALLTSLGFDLVEKTEAEQFEPESDESVMIKLLSQA